IPANARTRLFVIGLDDVCGCSSVRILVKNGFFPVDAVFALCVALLPYPAKPVGEAFPLRINLWVILNCIQSAVPATKELGVAIVDHLRWPVDLKAIPFVRHS